MGGGDDSAFDMLIAHGSSIALVNANADGNRHRCDLAALVVQDHELHAAGQSAMGNRIERGGDSPHRRAYARFGVPSRMVWPTTSANAKLEPCCRSVADFRRSHFRRQ